MLKREISIELAKKIIQHNPQLDSYQQDNLMEYGILTRETTEAVLANTPDLTVEEKQLIQNITTTIGRRGPHKGRINPDVLKALQDKLNTLAQAEQTDADNLEQPDNADNDSD